MIFDTTPLDGVYLIRPQRHHDERGFFARTFCEQEFTEQNSHTKFVQCSVSFTAKRGSIRGMHLQRPPHEEVKLVRCAQGRAQDVVVDLRPNSPNFGRWESFDLSADNGDAVLIPAGFAHGFQTLKDNTELFYMISAPYTPEAASGVRYDDPKIGIEWALPVTMVSEKDRSWPLLT